MEVPLQLTRYSEPTKMDVAPYMSTCTVGNGKDMVALYVQRNVDDEDPRWEYVTDVSVKSSDKKIQDIISKRYDI